MNMISTQHQRYVTDFQEFAKALAHKDPLWLREKRENAINHFCELGFPTARRNNENWKYTNAAPIAKTSFAYQQHTNTNGINISDIKRVAPWQNDWINLVFVDGHYSESLSTPSIHANEVQVISLHKALDSHSDLLEKHLGRYAPANYDGFLALNTAFIRDGSFVNIPEGKYIESPIQLLFISTERATSMVSHPRIIVMAGTMSKASIVETYVGISKNRYFTNSVSEIILGENAEIQHDRILLESENAFHVGISRIHQSNNSKFSSRSFSKGTALGRHDLFVSLDGSESSCYLNGLYITSNTQHMDHFINIDHTKPHTKSRLYYKGILYNKSKAVFGGTVWVQKNAQKTDAMQKDMNLLLSPDAEVDSKPALFIYADDVKCGHGATSGNIDQGTLFYMRSRGLDLETASHLLIYGFANEIIESTQIKHLNDYLTKHFLESLPAHKFEF